MYGFLLFAYIIWPIYAPISILLIEKSALRKKLLKIFFFLGLFVSAYFLIHLLIIRPTHVTITNGSINYITQTPYFWIITVLYMITVCGSCFISSNRFLVFFGTAILISFIAASWLYYATFTSVWCFFAGFLSLLLAVFLHFQEKS